MTRQTRVVVLVDSLTLGGAERIAVEAACGLDRRRFAPHVVVTRQSGPLRELLADAGVSHTLLNRTHKVSFPAYRRMQHIASDCDLIHSHKFGSNIWGAMLARTLATPLVAHEHNWNGVPSRMRSLCNRGWIAPAADRILCVSESVQEVMLSDGIPKHKLQVLHNGVLTRQAWPRGRARAELGLDAHEFIVGIVAELRPEKRHDVLIRAVEVLTRAGKSVRLCVVGDGPCTGKLKTLAAQLGVDDRVLWMGHRPEGSRLAAAFDVAVLCSDWEGLPLAGLEALDAGVPLVATAVGGLPRLLARGAGVLVPPNDPSKLASAISRLMERPEDAAALARKGQRRVREGYGLHQMILRLEEIYDDVLRHRCRRGGGRPLIRQPGAHP